MYVQTLRNVFKFIYISKKSSFYWPPPRPLLRVGRTTSKFPRFLCVCQSICQCMSIHVMHLLSRSSWLKLAARSGRSQKRTTSLLWTHSRSTKPSLMSRLMPLAFPSTPSTRRGCGFFVRDTRTNTGPFGLGYGLQVIFKFRKVWCAPIPTVVCEKLTRCMDIKQSESLGVKNFVGFEIQERETSKRRFNQYNQTDPTDLQTFGTTWDVARHFC